MTTDIRTVWDYSKCESPRRFQDGQKVMTNTGFLVTVMGCEWRAHAGYYSLEYLVDIGGGRYCFEPAWNLRETFADQLKEWESDDERRKGDER